MESIILIAFNNKIIKESDYNTCTNKEIINGLKEQKFLIRPSSFEEFKKSISNYNEKNNTTRKIVGIYPSGERIEIEDEESYKKEISIFLVLNVQIKKKLFSGLNAKGLFKSEINFLDNVKNTLNLVKKTTNNIKENINNIKKKLSTEIEQVHNNIIGSLVSNDNNALERSVRNIINNRKKNDETKLDNLKRSIRDFKKDVIDKKTNLLRSIQGNNEKLILVKTIVSDKEDIDFNDNDNDNEKEQVNNDDNKSIDNNNGQFADFKNIKEVGEKEVPDEEGNIFEFIEKLMNIECNLNDKIIQVENIKIKNISLKEYDFNFFCFFKDEKSDKNINFYKESKNEEFKNELHFTIDGKCKSQEEKNNLNLSLIVNEPKENSNYKMYISIINTISKKVISTQPLEVNVLYKKEGKKNINDILSKIKSEVKFFDFLSDKDAVKLIEDNINLREDQLKQIIEQNIEKIKEKKVKDLLDKFENEMQFSKFLNNDKVKEKILSFEFDEKKINEWILNQKPKDSEPRPKPGPGPSPDLDVEKIYKELDECYYVSSYMEDEIVKNKIIELNGDLKKLFDWVFEYEF